MKILETTRKIPKRAYVSPRRKRGTEEVLECGQTFIRGYIRLGKQGSLWSHSDRAFRWFDRSGGI